MAFGYGDQQGKVVADPANLFGQRTNQSRDQTVGQMLDPLGIFGDKSGSSILGPSAKDIQNQVANAPFLQPTVPGANKNLYDPSNPNSILNLQTEAAKSYRNAIPGSVKKDSDTLYGDYAQQARRGLANDIKNTRASYNSRGLLNSGMRSSAEMGNQANTQTDLANARLGLNSNLLNTRMNNANTMENNALNTGYAYSGSAPSLGASALYGPGQAQQTDIYNSQLQQQQLGSLAGATGKLAGSIYSNYNK